MTNYLTKQGLADVKAELKELKKVKLPEVLDALSKARADGDLSENAAYDAAKAAQAQLESKIAELEEVIADHKIIKEPTDDTKVHIGSTIEIEYQNLPTKENFVLTIVGSSEANAVKNKISNDSPLAHAVLGKKAGDICKFLIKGREMQVKIIKIS